MFLELNKAKVNQTTLKLGDHHSALERQAPCEQKRFYQQFLGGLK
jgi:hypothetical protein